MYENRIAHGNKTGELHNLVIDSPPEVTADANTSDTFTPWARMLDPGRTLLAAWEGVISSAINDCENVVFTTNQAVVPAKRNHRRGKFE